MGAVLKSGSVDDPPAPRLESVYFGGGIYERMANVLRFTAMCHCPNWHVNVRDVDVSAVEKSSFALPSHVHNTQKTDAWASLVESAADGERLLLMDADMFIVNQLDDVWDREFDFAYTTKVCRFPFNGGVMFVRVSDPVREFFRVWASETKRLLADASRHRPWRAKYGGIAQAALGSMLEAGATEGLHIAELPCWQWNCEDSSWGMFDPDQTRIVHTKSGLKDRIFNLPSRRMKPGVPELAELWRGLEELARQVAAETAYEAAE